MATATKGQEFLTTTQLAERWEVNPGTLENWRAQRKGPAYVKLGRGRGSPVLYRLADVVEYERTHTVRTREGR